ncbi:MAG TPA: c-type cytochrome [Mucilaginibacter sp.]|nr:c-type cytochrome [Mucilaginibacter sp.]
MKKAFIVIGLSLVIAACGGGKKSGNESEADSASASNKTAVATQSDADTSANHIGTDKASGTPAAAGAALIAKSDCQTCHKEQEKLIGPAFVDVAKKYTSSSAVIDTLANKIIKGGSGNWGTIPMGPHASVSVDDARSMVKYILSLKK